ncbi:zinc-ribbon domain-containing protein [Salinicola avicenniae]|uniref:zinc-ribbon domain-containing protein n=1 Tax=Salinicola avicenniae TaxID=2916836 RepID=UPI002073D9CB|nr:MULTISPECIES: zinc-ribbon domain-containing protein [unclassified Salinicola]
MDCPYCREEIQDGAIKCKHCGSMLGENAAANVEVTSAFGYFKKCFQLYCVFQGRARRREYWFFVLFSMIFSLATGWLDAMLFDSAGGFGVFNLIYNLAVILPSLAVTVRRLHDTGRSGWWMWISLVPVVGAIVLLVFLVQDSQPDNGYGRNPKFAGPGDAVTVA